MDYSVEVCFEHEQQFVRFSPITCIAAVCGDGFLSREYIVAAHRNRRILRHTWVVLGDCS